MRTAAFLLTAFALLSAAPVAPASTEAPCHWMDGTATSVSIMGDTFYKRTFFGPSFRVEQVWREANGETGLQPDREMTCTGKADRLLEEVCIGTCPIHL